MKIKAEPQWVPVEEPWTLVGEVIQPYADLCPKKAGADGNAALSIGGSNPTQHYSGQSRTEVERVQKQGLTNCRHILDLVYFVHAFFFWEGVEVNSSDLNGIIS